MTMLQMPSRATFGRALSGIGQGLMAAGSPQGWSGFGTGFSQGVGAYDDRVDREELRKYRKTKMDMEQQQLEAQQAEAVAKAAQDQQWRDWLASQGGMMSAPAAAGMPAGPGQQLAQAGGADLGPGMMSPQFTPQQLNILSQLPPEEAQKLVAQQAFQKPDKPAGPQSGIGKIMADLNAGLIDKATADALIKKETYIAPTGGGDGVWEQYIDPKTGRSGQRNTRTGKIDWDPGNTLMTVVGTDQNGNPIYDLVSGSPGPTKEYEAKLANQSTLLEQGLDGLEKLVGEGKVSSTRAAIGEGLSLLGPLGDVASESLVLGPAEKQYMAKRASALESLANTITGAAFSEEQKRNFISMLPKPTDDDATFKDKMASMRQYIGQLKKTAKVPEQDTGEGWTDVDGVKIRAKP